MMSTVLFRMLPLVWGCSKPREVGLWLGLPVARPCPGGTALVLKPLFVSSLIPGSHQVPKVSVLEGDSCFICCVLVGGTNANLHTRPVMCPGIRSQMGGDRRATGMRPHAHHVHSPLVPSVHCGRERPLLALPLCRASLGTINAAVHQV